LILESGVSSELDCIARLGAVSDARPGTPRRHPHHRWTPVRHAASHGMGVGIGGSKVPNHAATRLRNLGTAPRGRPTHPSLVRVQSPPRRGRTSRALTARCEACRLQKTSSWRCCPRAGRWWARDARSLGPTRPGNNARSRVISAPRRLSTGCGWHMDLARSSRHRVRTSEARVSVRPVSAGVRGCELGFG
jgi:hypothetical protein